MRRLAWLLTVAVVVGCSAAVATSLPPAGRTTVTVFGAASLKSALEQLKTAYESADPGTAVVLSTDSSAALVTQIEQGAPADVFLSADVTNAKKVVDRNLADGALVPFAGNVLTIVVPTENRAKVATPADLAKRGLRVIAAGDEVPITAYATEVVARLASEPSSSSDFAAAYARNIVSREDNVKAVVAKIELGEGDAAIVYATDARASKGVTSIEIPVSANVPATYAGVVVRATRNRPGAHAFLEWMTAPEAQRILAGLGFTPPPSL